MYELSYHGGRLKCVQIVLAIFQKQLEGIQIIGHPL
jgi:hypothetical protein